MKKLLTMFFVILCLCGLILTACTGQEKNPNDDTTGTTDVAGIETTTASPDDTTDPSGNVTSSTDPLYNPDDWSKNY